MTTLVSSSTNQLVGAYVNGFLKRIDECDRDVAEEIELPITTRTGYATSFQSVWCDLSAGEDWQMLDDFTLAHTSGYQIKPEATWSTAEVITPPCATLCELSNGVVRAVSSLAVAGWRRNVRFLSYGMQPRTTAEALAWLPHPRYAALRRSLGARTINPMLVTASQQCHVRVAANEAILALNVLNSLSGVIIALCAHAPIGEGKEQGYKAARERAWRAFPRERVGIFPRRFHDLEDLANYLLDCHLIFNAGNWVYDRRLRDYLHCHDLSLEDAMVLWQVHEGALWHVARLRWRHEGRCTIEVRCGCPQLPGDHTLSAVTLGLIANLGEACELCDTLSLEDCEANRRLAIQHGLTSKMHSLVDRVLDIARTGLLSRGYGEEIFLRQAFKRLSRRCCLADDALKIFRDGGFEKLVQQRSWYVRDY